MNKLYLLLIFISAAFTAKAQPTIPAAPVTCNANLCTTNSNIDVCPVGNTTVVTDHRGGVYNRGNDADHLGNGAIWRYRNIATVSGVTVNGEVRIDNAFQATLNSIDDDAAVDQANISIASFFAPRISPDQNLNGTNRRGYVQFTMTFYRNATGANNNTVADFANAVSLTKINYVHYDIDGNDAGNVNSGTAGSWFRETGLAQRVTASNPVVLANSPTDLVGYSYTDAGNSWTGFAGTTCERDGVSRCAQVASSFSYAGSLPSITFRMGYDYNAGNNVGRPIRQYGSRLGCFNFPSQATLPVRLLSFTAAYRNQSTTLNWSADNEVNFEKYYVERSSNASDFSPVGERAAIGSSPTLKNDYQLNDDLTSVSGNTFYYRLKMMDRDGTFKFSQVLMIKKETKSLQGISISPNPVRSGTNTVRFTSTSAATIDLKVLDLTGKTLVQQQQKIFQGNNSISVNNLDRLPPGTYVLQMMNEGELSVVKFSVAR